MLENASSSICDTKHSELIRMGVSVPNSRSRSTKRARVLAETQPLGNARVKIQSTLRLRPEKEFFSV